MTDPFSLFGPSHLVVLLATFLLCIACFFVPKVVPNSKIGWISTIITLLLILQIASFNLYHLVFKADFDPASHLPFHLCSISIYLTAVAVFINNKKLNTLQYYLCPMAGIAALVFPDIGAGENFPAFRFIEFFWSHSLIVVATCFILATREVSTQFKDFAIACITLLGLMAMAFPINYFSGGNYFYLRSKPAGGGSMDYFGPEPYHILGLVLVGFVALVLQWGLLAIVDKIRQKFGANKSTPALK